MILNLIQLIKRYKQCEVEFYLYEMILNLIQLIKRYKQCEVEFSVTS